MRENITTYILCGLFVVFACFAQANSYLNTDSAWLVDSARKLLSGRNLYTDYIETNPPFIVYFTALPLFFGIGFRPFVFLLLGLSCWLSFKHVNSNFLKITVAFGLFFLSGNVFAQREHLFVALILPYFFAILASTRPRFYEILLAGLAILIKPYFVVFLFGFAIWQWLALRRSLFLRENFIIGFMLLLYIVLIYIFESDYLNNVLPLLTKYYGDFYYKKASWQVTLLIFVLLVFVPFGLIKNSILLNRKISFAVLAAFLGGVTFLLQNKGWTNHYYPLYFFLLVSIALLAENATTKILQLVFGLIIAGMIVHAAYVNFLLICKFAQEDSKQVTKLMNQYARDKEVVGIGFNLDLLYPEIIYSKAHFNWEYPLLWMLSAMYNKNEVKDKRIIHHKPNLQADDEAKIFTSMVNYVATQKPAMIIVTDNIVNNERLGEYKFGFIEYFSQAPRFRNAFKNYRKIKMISGREIYILDPPVSPANMAQQR